MLKKATGVIVCVVMLLSLGACGIKQKISDKIAEKVTEGVLEKAAGGNTDIDLSQGKISVKGEDGKEVSIGGGEWPKTGAAKLIPEFKKGKIVSVMSQDEGCMISLEEVEASDYEKYVEDLKGKGFIHDVSEYSSGGITTYEAHNDGGYMAGATYTADGKIFNIIVQAGSEDQESED